jgi:glycolate oxidase iron-sulfur subunit
MQTNLHPIYKDTPDGREADAILRSCVHCGFCTATCPTYQQLNDERDGPRGRIYLIKQLLEEDSVTTRTQTHIDRCLTCRACETTCPSGVAYGRLVDIGRGIMEAKNLRTPLARWVRWLVRKILPYPSRFAALLFFGRIARPLLPAFVKDKIPPLRKATVRPASNHTRIMIGLGGCTQPSATPNTNAAAARLLDRLGISLFETPAAGCCGALDYHLGAHTAGKAFMKRNIDSWWPVINAGAEAIVTTASGCGSMLADYGHIFRNDPDYAEKAQQVSALAKDISEVVATEVRPEYLNASTSKVAIHCPCSLQHALKLPNQVEQILLNFGFHLAAIKDKHLCCGSSGTYSLLQPKMSQQLLSNKLTALTGDNPHIIVTSNVGCQLHLETLATKPVMHWIELLEESLQPMAND